jgi:hypothetical protein
MTSLVIHTLVLNIPVFDHSAHQENATQKCIFESSSEMDKGQLILEGNFGVFKSPIERTFLINNFSPAFKMGQINKERHFIISHDK